MDTFQSNVVFKELKKDFKPLSVNNNSNYDYYYMLDMLSGEYFYITACAKDKKTTLRFKEIISYSGEDEHLLSVLKNIENERAFMIDWTNQNNKIDINVYPHILPMLSACRNIIDHKGEKITFSKDIHNFRFNAIDNGSHYDIKMELDYKEVNQLQFISHDYCFADNEILPIISVGSEYSLIHNFRGIITKDVFQNYLSLFYSHFSERLLFIENYTVNNRGEIKAVPIIHIEKIDEQKNCIIRILSGVSEIDQFFLSDYGLTKVAFLTKDSKNIDVYGIDYSIVSGFIIYFEGLLANHVKAVSGIKGYDVEGTRYFIASDIAERFLTAELGHLFEKCTVTGDEKLIDYNIKKVSPFLKMNFSSGVDFFEGAVEISFEDRKFTLFEFLEMYKKDSWVVLNDNKRGIINSEYVSKLERLFKKKNKSVEFNIFDLPLLNDLIPETKTEEIFQKALTFFNGINSLSDMKLKQPGVNAVLRDYQIRGYHWLKYLYDYSYGGCLADDMGLGKTLQTIALLNDIYKSESLSSLIIVPKSLIVNWDNEIKRFAPSLTTYIYYGQNKNYDEAKNFNVIITTYETVRSDIESLKDKEFLLCILDEAQKIKNISSKVTKAVLEINAKKRLALSGTPIENHLGELYSLFRFLNPGMFGSHTDFNAKYIVPIQKDNKREILSELKKKIYPFIMRRLKSEVLKELPDKIEQDFFVEMDELHEKFYKERRDYFYTMIKSKISESGIATSQIFIFQALNELRQIASMPELVSNNSIKSSKCSVLIDQLSEVIDNSHKALVFANFIGSLELIGAELEKQGIAYSMLTGQTRNRQELVDNFQNSSECKVFLMTLKSGGVGLNLTAADYVFIYDPWWNSSSESQAVDRAHRIGQKNTVFSYRLITKGTIEEKIRELQLKKTGLIDMLIESDKGSIKSLSTEDIDFLFGAV